MHFIIVDDRSPKSGFEEKVHDFFKKHDQRGGLYYDFDYIAPFLVPLIETTLTTELTTAVHAGLDLPSDIEVIIRSYTVHPERKWVLQDIESTSSIFYELESDREDRIHPTTSFSFGTQLAEESYIKARTLLHGILILPEHMNDNGIETLVHFYDKYENSDTVLRELLTVTQGKITRLLLQQTVHRTEISELCDFMKVQETLFDDLYEHVTNIKNGKCLAWLGMHDYYCYHSY